MRITLYKFSKRENSTLIPKNEGLTLDCFLKENTSVYNPSFILNISDISYTYLKWGYNYYYVNDITSVSSGVWQFDCEIDVLASYKNDIGNTSAFVKYSASNYNVDIPDFRLTAGKDSIINKTSKKLFETGEYYIGFFAVPPGNGTGIKCFDSYIEYYKATSCLNTRDFLEKTVVNIGDYISKAYNNVTDCFFGSFLLPIKPNYLTGALKLTIGINYDTGAVAHEMETFTKYSTDIDIPFNFNDFRNRGSYTSVIVYLPGCGTAQLNTDDLIGHASLHVDFVMCNYNGDITYTLSVANSLIFTAKGNVATQLFATSQSGNFVASMSSLAQGGLGSAISGNPLSAISGAFNSVLCSMQSQIGSFGGGGGISTININSNVEITVISHNTNVSPSQMTNVQGRPLNEVKKIGDLSGYVECYNASVNTQAPQSLKDQINSFLNGGFYYV